MNNKLAFFAPQSEATTLVGKTAENDTEKAILVNAIMSPDHALADMVNMSIPLVNFYMEKIQMRPKLEDGSEDMEGEARDAIRTVLIDQNGESYACASIGVSNAIRTICNFYGTPDTWGGPLMVTVKQINKNKNRILTLVVTTQPD